MADTEHGAERTARRTAAAWRALGLTHTRPGAAARAFQSVLHSPSAGPAAQAIAHWGVGQLAHARGEIAVAIDAFAASVDRASAADDHELAAQIRVSWAACEQSAGHTAAALEQLDRAEPHLTGVLLGKALTQRGFVLAVVGDRDAALGYYDAGLPLLLHGGDEVAALRSLLNRGTMLMQLGRYREAVADLTLAHELADRHDQRALAAGAIHGQAYLDAKLGHTVQAARGFAEARARYLAIGSLERHLLDLDIDECEVMLDWGLGSDAAPLAQRVAEAARRDGNMAQLGEALLMLARAHVIAGEPGAAIAAADDATAVFDAAQRPAWSALARYWALVAAGSDPGSAPALLRRLVTMRRLAETLDRHGWGPEAAEVRMLTARLAVEAGRRDMAAELLARTASARQHPNARVRAEAAHAAALLHVAEGDLPRARRALVAGLSAVAHHRRSLGAVELRSSAGQFGAPLAATGLRLALDVRHAGSALQWAERGRAGALAAPAGVGGQLASEALRAQLRGARQRLSLTPGDAAVGSDAAAEVAVLEAEISRANRQRLGADGSVSSFRPALLTAALRVDGGDTVLIEYVESDSELYAILCRPSGIRLVPLGPVSALVTANDHLLFAIRRLALLPDGPAARRAWAAAMAARADVDRVLLAPFADAIAGQRLVVVPTGALNGVLWNALPTAALARGVRVAPSAAWWARGTSASTPRARPRGVLLVAGPELAHATEEVAALQAVHPGATVLAGPDATAERVLTAMEHASMVHIAAHGVFRADNPLFSTLQMHDGPLFVHELEGLSRVPAAVVLAACSSGRSGVLPGDELLGTSAVLMGLGVQSLVAPLLPVADGATVEVALAVHGGFRRGGPAAALGRLVRRAVNEQRPDLFAAAATFTCVSTSRASAAGG